MLRLDINLVFTVINLIVLFLLMKKFLLKPITDIMESRKLLIEKQLADASMTEKSAIELKIQYEDSIKDARLKTDEMLETARKNANVEYTRIIEEANVRTEKIINDAEKTIRIEREKTLSEMQSEIAGLAIIAATKVIKGNMNDSSNELLYKDFLNKAGDINETNSN